MINTIPREYRARTKTEARDYYEFVYDNGLYSREELYRIYEDAESKRKEWEEYSKKGIFQKRDYESYCNTQAALKEMFIDRFNDASLMGYDEYQSWLVMMNID